MLLLLQLDPANNKTILELQQEAALEKEQERSQSQKAKGKRKAAEADLEDDDEMDVDITFDADDDAEEGSDDGENVDMDEEGGEGQDVQPMPASGGIQELRDRLHARMAALRRGGRGGGYVDWEASSRDDLIEERRRQRATLRENRRKETREKIKREAEAKGKKGKEKDRTAGPTTKVRSIVRNHLTFISTMFTATTPGPRPTYRLRL